MTFPYRSLTRFLLPSLCIGVLLLASACSGSDDVFGPNQGGVEFRLRGTGGPAKAIPGDFQATDRANQPKGDVGPRSKGHGHDHDHDDDDDDGDGGNPDLPFDPSDFLISAKVTFASMLARNLDGELVDVNIDLPAVIDLLDLDEDDPTVMPLALLPAGTYDQVVVVMTNVTVATLNGTEISVTPPGGGWTSVIQVCPFTVEDGATIDVDLRFLRENAFREVGGGIRFEPEFMCE